LWIAAGERCRKERVHAGIMAQPRSIVQLVQGTRILRSWRHRQVGCADPLMGEGWGGRMKQ
jgi:hypothetical protein